jgi:hypothetical protein
MFAFFNRHRVFLLFLALVAGQLLTWRAIINLHKSIETLGFVMLQKTCGGDPSEIGNYPCHVVIDKPNPTTTAPLIGPDTSLLSK